MLTTETSNVPEGCKCDPKTWPNGIDKVCDLFVRLVDENKIDTGMCLCGHEKECHAEYRS